MRSRSAGSFAKTPGAAASSRRCVSAWTSRSPSASPGSRAFWSRSACCSRPTRRAGGASRLSKAWPRSVGRKGPATTEPSSTYLLSARASAGEAARPLQRADLERLEAVWREESYRVFGLRLRERIVERDSPLGARAEELRQRWVEASREAQRVLVERVWGRTPPEDLSQAPRAAVTARAEWQKAREALASAAAGRETTPRREVVHVRLQGGREALSGVPAPDRDVVLGRALDRLGLEKVRGLIYPIAGNERDLGLSLYYERGAVDRGHLCRVAQEGLGAELARAGCRPVDGEVRVVVTAPIQPDNQAPVRPDAATERPAAADRTWADGRVYSRHFHLPAEGLTRLPLESQRAVVLEAIARQWPELQARGLEASFVLRTLPDDPRIVRLTVLVPERELDAFRAVTRPGGQSGLVGEVDRVVAAVRGGELSIRGTARAERSPDVRGAAGPGRVLEALSIARPAAESPVRAAARAAIDTLSRAMPAPLRSAHTIVRHAGAILRREED
jgi:hypothetical protein